MAWRSLGKLLVFDGFSGFLLFFFFFFKFSRDSRASTFEFEGLLQNKVRIYVVSRSMTIRRICHDKYYLNAFT